jgi:hypothetical protein
MKADKFSNNYYIVALFSIILLQNTKNIHLPLARLHKAPLSLHQPFG